MDTAADTNQQKTTTDWSAPKTDSSVPQSPSPMTPTSQSTAANFFAEPTNAATVPSQTPPPPPTVTPPSSPPPPPSTPMSTSGDNFTSSPPKKSVPKALIAGIVVLLLAIAVPVTYYVVNQNTENRTKAASAINCATTCTNGQSFGPDACPGDTGSGGTFGSCQQWATEACNSVQSTPASVTGGFGTCGGGGQPAATPGDSCVANKVAGDSCDPSCGDNACDGSGPLACQQCGANTSAAGQMRCFDGRTLDGVIAGCGAGGVASPPPGGQSPAPSTPAGCIINYSGNSFSLSGTCAGQIRRFNGPSCPTSETNVGNETAQTGVTYAPQPPAGGCQQVDFQPSNPADGGGVCACAGSAPSPSPSIPPSSSPSPVAQCTNVKLYQVTGNTTLSTSWHELTVEERSALKAGDVVYVTTSGSASGTAQVTRARIRVNSTTWTANNETVLKKPKAASSNVADEYYIIYTIPAGTINFTIGAEVYSPSFDNNGNPSDGHTGWR